MGLDQQREQRLVVAMGHKAGVLLRGVVVVERKKPAGAGGRLTWNALVEPNDEANHTIQRRIRRAIATSILRVLRRNQSYASTSAISDEST
mgnify:CR=1 FL=1